MCTYITADTGGHVMLEAAPHGSYAYIAPRTINYFRLGQVSGLAYVRKNEHRATDQ